MQRAPQKIRLKWGLLEEGSDHRDGGLLHLLRAGALRPDRGHPNRHNAIPGDVHHREALTYDVALFNLIFPLYVQNVAQSCFIRNSNGWWATIKPQCSLGKYILHEQLVRRNKQNTYVQPSATLCRKF